MALPDFGLMTKADKQKLDGISSSTYLTTAAASSTYLTQASASETYLTIATANNIYATKAEVREYIRQVVESDTGYVFLNGNGSEVGVISAMTASLQLSVSPTEANVRATSTSHEFTVTTNSTGAITVNYYSDEGEELDIGDLVAGDYFGNTQVNGNIITVTRSVQKMDLEYEYITMRISVSADGTYPAGSVDVRLILE